MFMCKGANDGGLKNCRLQSDLASPIFNSYQVTQKVEAGCKP